MSKPWIRVLRIANTSLFWIHFRFPWRWSTWYCKASLLVSTSSTNHQHHQKKRSAKGEIQSLCRRLDGTSVTWVRLTTEISRDRYIFLYLTLRLIAVFISGRFTMSTDLRKFWHVRISWMQSFRFHWWVGPGTVDQQFLVLVLWWFHVIKVNSKTQIKLTVNQQIHL